MFSDIVYAFRQLRRAPGFAITAILTLALGIGANTAIFTLIDSILLRPLPYPEQDRLMHLGDDGSSDHEGYFPKGWIRVLGQHATSFTGISAYGFSAESNVGNSGSSDRLFGAQVMTNAFDVLGIHPAAGRFFSPEDGIAGHEPVVVLNFGFWRDHLGSNPAAIGQTLRIDGVSRRIVGITPAGTHFPYADTQFVVPVTFDPNDVYEPWKIFDLHAFGRLREGVSPARAQAELRSLHGSLLPLFPWRMPDAWAAQTNVVPLLASQVGDMRPRLMVLFAAVGLILLIACANVANLMLARAARREREMAIRGALGASGSRIVRQLVTESLVLGFVAGAVGICAAAMTVRGLVHLLPADTPRLAEVSLQWPVFLFAAAASLLTGLLFGSIPAIKMASPDLNNALRSGSRGIAGSAGQFRIAMLLVVGQIGLSVLVITTAGLMLHSLWRMTKSDPGFRTGRVVTAEVALDSTACQAQGHCKSFFDSLLERMNGIAGAADVALADTLPINGRSGSFVYDAEGHPREARTEGLQATSRIVSPGYFPTLGLRLLRGRLLSRQDSSGASRAVVISQGMAQRLWPGQDPIGRHILNVREEPTPGAWVPEKARIVVGVVNNTREGSLAGNFDDEVYLPITPQDEQPVFYILLRTSTGTGETASELRRAVGEIDPAVPVTHIRSLNEVVGETVSASRSVATLLLGFGVLALAIGGVGVYSLIAFIVSWRTKEIGIRLALGAQRSQIIRSIVGQSLMLAGMGSFAGLAGAAFGARFLRTYLSEIQGLDPLTFGSVALIMVLIAVAAAWIPARRAAGVDPIRTLRME